MSAQPEETSLIPRTTLSEIVAHRNAAMVEIDRAVELIAEGYRRSEKAEELAKRAHGSAVFYGEDRTKLEDYRRLFGDFDPEASRAAYRAQLDAQVWTNLMTLTGLDTLMDRTAKAALHKSLCEEVPEITEQNVLATFAHYRDSAGLIFQRGLARCFADLDRRFKSHDGFKIGARIVLTHVFDEWGHWNYSSRQRDTIMDVERTLAVLAGRPKGYRLGSIIEAITEARGHGMRPKVSVTEGEFFRVRTFKNGNAHLWFRDDELIDRANRVLADYYGEVLPDGVDAETSHDDLRTKSTALAKDLSFYATPKAVVDRLLADWDLDDALVLEPSAGTGHIVSELLHRGARVEAVEVHPERARQLSAAKFRSYRLTVRPRNFLTMPVDPKFDYVAMNPPFYGTHWMDHVRHAFEFLKPGGVLRAVLPITAELGESRRHEEFRAWAEQRRKNSGWGSMFDDLPPESFAESGTRINTVILTLRRER